MNFDITLIGLNHRTAGVDVRERFALTDYCSPETWALPSSDILNESLILSTCNRVELLGVGTGDLDNHIISLWSTAKNEPREELERHIYIYHNLDAVRHIFNVASSLDSMVIGEPQILGQLKKAYKNASEAKKTGSILNRLLHKAFSVAKRVRNETAVASSAVSISYAAVELAKRIFGQMNEQTALLIGAGEMAELAATHLLQAGIQKIFIVNRTLIRAQELAKKFNGQAVAFENLPEILSQSDIVIASTGSPSPIIGTKEMEEALKVRKNSPMFMIDIAVPRDIDPAVNALDNLYLYDIDDLRGVVEENRLARKSEAIKASAIVEEEAAIFNSWLRGLEIEPTIKALLNKESKVCEAELSKAMKKLGALTPGQKETIEALARSIAGKLSRDPLMYLKGGMDNRDRRERINLVRGIYRLDGDD
ncbi:MAG: glutamyl-tRNA reductase [Desulfovibrio sp.]|nr:glutamyl-tRNA reductase [Desulfovibrio sp.]